MENLNITGENYIPAVNFDLATGVLEIAGESYHEYTIEFYQPIFNWLNAYLSEPNRTITFNFRMTYYNTSTSRRFLEIFDLLEEYQNEKGGKVTVNWYYQKDDVDMLESGEEYSEDVDLTFNLLPY
ncbi:MAG: DUF1987 domain-containing protein [Cytophagales bacterium]|nr:MAG: DUF1987 domain-containing protein [Cytophagales bacterium]TAF60373.1 MAG: DUF1987 domain-containing protein [Cytophagales bacterium]